MPVWQRDESSLQCRRNRVLQLVGEISCVKKAESRPAENVALLGFLQLFADQRRTFQPYLNRRMAAAFQPLDQLRDLGRASGTVRALDNDQPAGQFVQIHSRETVAIKLARGRPGNHDPAVKAAFYSCGP